MRCKACNKMIPVTYTPRASLEELCSRCRQYVYYDLLSKYVSVPNPYEESEGSDILDEVRVIQDTEEDRQWDRNHDDFLDDLDYDYRE